MDDTTEITAKLTPPSTIYAKMVGAAGAVASVRAAANAMLGTSLYAKSVDYAGASGVPGASGASGASGTSNGTGASGASGVPGATGATGASGATGATGATGASGVPGATGATGASGIAGASASGDYLPLSGGTVTGNISLLGTTIATGKITANGQGALSALTDNDVITKKALNEWPFLSPYQPIYDYPLNAGWSTAAGGTGGGVNQVVDNLNLRCGQSSTAYASAQVPQLQLTPLANPTTTGYSRIDWNGKLFIDVVVQPAYDTTTNPYNQYKGVRQMHAIAASYIGAAATTNVATPNTVGPGLCLSPIAAVQSASVSVGILTYYPSSTSIEVRIIQSLRQTNGNKVLDASNATPIIITTAGPHSLSTGNNIEVAGVLGNVAANGFWTITVLSATTLSLNGSVGSGAYTVGGAIQITSPVLFTQTGLNINRYTLQVTGGIATLYVNDTSVGSLSGFYDGTGAFGSFINYVNTTAVVSGLAADLGGGNFYIKRCRVGGIF